MTNLDTILLLQRQSADGRQVKGTDGDWWYKIDSHGYEAVAEDVCSSLSYRLGVRNHLQYQQCSVTYKGMPMRACRSKNFVPDGCVLLTLDELAYVSHKIELLDNFQITTPRVTLIRFLDVAEKIVGAPWIRDYIIDMLWLDVLYFNTDRHTGNISILSTPDGLSPVPYYDFGEALFSDVRVFNETTLRNPNDVIEKCLINPFQMTVKQLAGALRYQKEFPWDLSRLEGVTFSTLDTSIGQRVRSCLDVTISTIKET